jgi:nucleotide-binding universal stress UspA family protein
MTNVALAHAFSSGEAGVGPPADDADRVLLPVVGSLQSRWLPTLAGALAADKEGDLFVATVVSVPEQTPPSLTGRPLERHRDQLEGSLETVSEAATETPVTGVVRVGIGSVPVIAGVVREYGVSTVVLGDGDRSQPRFPYRRSAVERLRSKASCRVVLADDGVRSTDCSAILVPVAGGPHVDAVVDVARAIAEPHDAWIELLHVLEPDAGTDRRERAHRLLESSASRLDGEQWDTWLLEAEDVAEAIIEQSTYYDATVLGGPRKGRLRRFVFGSTTSTVQDRAESAVLTVWAEREPAGRLGRWLGDGR